MSERELFPAAAMGDATYAQMLRRIKQAERERDELRETIARWCDVTQFIGTHRTCECQACMHLRGLIRDTESEGEDE